LLAKAQRQPAEQRGTARQIVLLRLDGTRLGRFLAGPVIDGRCVSGYVHRLGDTRSVVRSVLAQPLLQRLGAIDVHSYLLRRPVLRLVRTMDDISSVVELPSGGHWQPLRTGSRSSVSRAKTVELRQTSLSPFQQRGGCR